MLRLQLKSHRFKITPEVITKSLLIIGLISLNVIVWAIFANYLEKHNIIIPKIEFSDIQVEIETSLDSDIQGATVDFVDSGKINECPEESIECAKGSVLPPLDITSPQTVYNSVINQCIDFDSAFGSQCYDFMAYFHYVYTGRWLSTNGTGAAYGIWDAREYNNVGNEYELIYDTHSIRAGDFVVFHNGIYGHVGMALGEYNNGYIALLGTNQGGAACYGGGAAANAINMSLASFSGAFRPRKWIAPEPTPTPTHEGYIYKPGDYFSKFLVEQGYSDGTNLWGENGDVNFYNKQLFDKGILTYYNGKYYNNIPIGTEIILEAK